MSVVMASSRVQARDFSGSLFPLTEWGVGFEPLRQVLAIPLPNEQLAQVSDLRALRSLSRAGMILYRVAVDCFEKVGKKNSVEPHRIGLYCAMDQGPMDLNLVNELSKSSSFELGNTLIRATMPKQIFKMYPNYSTNQIGITLGVQGPMQTFTNLKFAAVQCLEQAEHDLDRGAVDLAFVGSAFALEDPYVGLRLLSQCPAASVLSEGGAFLALQKSQQRTSWKNLSKGNGELFFGIADPLMNILNQGNSKGKDHEREK